MSRWIYLIPVLGFGVIAIFLFKSLFLGPANILPSALIDKPAPDISLPPVDATMPGFSRADLAAGHVTVINFFASWCVPCHQEAGQLMALSRMPGVTLYGIDYKERQEGAGPAFLRELGNPFSRLVDDRAGHVGIDWGVDGVPETFVVDGRGIIRFKYVGPMDEKVIANQLLPEVEKARAL